MNDKLASNDPLIQKVKIAFETLNKISSEVTNDVSLIHKNQIESFDFDELLLGWDKLLTTLEDADKLVDPVSNELKHEYELRMQNKDVNAYDTGLLYRQMDIMLLTENTILEDTVYLKIAGEFNYLVLFNKDEAIKLIDQIYQSIMKLDPGAYLYANVTKYNALKQIEKGDPFKDNNNNILVLINHWFKIRHNQKK